MSIHDPDATLHRQAAEFFRVFARCEYSLKAAGFLKPRRQAEASWTDFAAVVSNVIDHPSSDELREAVEYLLSNPPKRQVVADGCLAWDEARPDARSKAELVLLYVCRVRNNLFHGGKFNGRWFQPERSGELMKHGLIILRACISACPEVRDAYHQAVGA